jgi:protoporphyrin/coproporphyrin ferrochelatase
MAQTAYLLVNFGGPRTLNEVEPFLRALLTDKDVIRTQFPQPLHNYLFGRVAKKRAKKITHDYAKLGGGSPIWADTEYVAEELRKKLRAPVLTFHRYLPSTHKDALFELHQIIQDEVRVFPFFPQFTYATKGSIARFFKKHCSLSTLQKLRWVKSYPAHPSYITVVQKHLREFLDTRDIDDEEAFLLFSAHGLPQQFVLDGDLYQYECQLSYRAVMQAFPKTKSLLCYQSKFGPGEWLRPYTDEICQKIENYALDKTKCVFVPISFTSDHIETLFEVEEQYMPLIAKCGLYPFRAPALNRRLDWIEAIIQMLSDSTPCSNSMLIRN